MKFRELREYYEAEDDNFNSAKIDDTRKNRLTLNHLNKLRKKRELERLEKQNVRMITVKSTVNQQNNILSTVVRPLKYHFLRFSMLFS